jgi:hypothetical protein
MPKSSLNMDGTEANKEKYVRILFDQAMYTAAEYISPKAPTLMHFINLSLISPTHFGALPHYHQVLCISCCKTKHIVVSRCTSSILISRTT